MYIQFNDDCKISITLFNTPLKPVIEKMFKHLGQVPLPFRSWDHPYYRVTTQLVQTLEIYAKKLNIIVDKAKCLAQDQLYFNHLHKIYEKGYDGNPDWLDYHEHIHLCEKKLFHRSDLILYHRELSGPLAQPMNLKWLKISTHQLQPGDLYVEWAELGKTPYTYWMNNEPDNKEQLCNLAKPWVNLYSKLTVSFSNRTLFPIHNQTDFDLWWQSRSQDWCQHWNIDSWTLADMNSVIVVGKIDNFHELTNILHGPAVPTYVRLD
jgi:hypothetical protein